MQSLRINAPAIIGERKPLVAGGMMMAVAVCLAGLFLLIEGGALDSYPYLFLLPWVLGLAVVFALPSLFLVYRGEFSLAHPLVFATWSYLFPAFILGGIFLAGGWSDPYYLAFVQDPREAFPLTIVIVGLGFGGLCLGYFIPAGEWVGARIAERLPTLTRLDAAGLSPGYVLFLLGVVNTTVAFVIGILGYQKGETMTSYDGLVYLTTLFWAEGSFVLWCIVFRARRLTTAHWTAIVVLLSTALVKAAFAGSRGALLSASMTIGLAYVLSGRTLKFRQYLIAAAAAVALLTAGMIYGSVFRSVKGSEAQKSMDEYANDVAGTFDEISRHGPSDLVDFAVSRMTERLDIVSSLAVVVSNYERLKPYEEAYGISDNIYTDTVTFFIPRIVWPEKPTASDPRRYGELYFEWGESSPAVTPFGDLLRNFGMIGVPVGMLALGFVLRVIRRSLIDKQPWSLWRTTFYFMLLTSVSYEGFYGTIIPMLAKDGVVAAVGIAIAVIVARRSGIAAQRVATV